MKLRAVLALLLVAACKKTPTDGGLMAVVKIDPGARVTCLELSISNTDGVGLTSARFPVDGKPELQIGIGQTGEPDLPADVRLRVQGLWSASGCTDGKPNATPADSQGRFIAGKVTAIDFTVRAPGPADDSDGDGYTGSTKGGPDCDDSVRTTNPGAAEACTMPVDFNCNGRMGCDDAACAGLACVRPAVALSFTNLPLSVPATMCSPALVIEARDSQGMPAPVGNPVTVTLMEQGALALQLYEDSGCSLPATSKVIPRMQTEVRFYARSSRAGLTRLLAQATGFDPAQQDFRITAGPAVSIAFSTAAQTVKADACSAPVTVEARDFSNNAASVSAAAPLTLTLTPAMGTSLFSDASCSAALTAPAIASGMPSFTFYFKPSRAPGMVRFDATAGALGMATQTQTVIPGDPTRIVFVTAAQRVVAGVCSGAMTVKLQDAQLTDTVAAMQTSLSLAGPTMTFYSTSTCATGSELTAASIPAGAGTATVYFRATGAGMPNVTVTGAGLTNAAQVQRIDPAAPVRLGFTTPAQGVQTTLCSGAVTLSAVDPFGNPSPITGAPLAITMSASPPTGFTFHPGAGCAGAGSASLSIPVGMSSVTFSYRGNTAGMVTMTAASALDPDPTQVTNIGVMPPSSLVYVTTAQTRLANECSGAVTLEARDTGGNRSNVASALTINLAAAPSTNFQFFSDPQCTTAVNQVTLPANASQVSFYFLGTNATTVAMTPSSALAGPGAQSAIIRPAAASAVAFLLPARTATAGVCSQSLTLQTRDAFGNVAPVSADLLLALSSTPTTGLTFHGDAACATGPVTTATIPAMQSQVVLYARGTQTPSYALLAQAPSVGMATQALTVNAAAAAKLVVVTGPQTLFTGECSGALTFERRDAFDNPITAPVALNVALTGGAGITFHAAPGCGSPAIGATTIPASSATVTVYFRGTVPGTPSVTGTGSGVATAGTQAQAINVSPPSVLAFVTPPRTTVVAGAVSEVLTVESRDGFGNPSPVTANTPVTLSTPPASFVYCSDAQCAGVDPVLQLAMGSSQVSFYFRGNVATSFTITATSAVGTTAPQSAAVVAAGASQLVFTTSPQSRPVGGCSLVTTVQRQDQFGNPVTVGGLAVGLAASPASGFTFHTTSNCMGGAVTGVSIAAGQHSASFYFNGTVPASVQVTASASGIASAQQTEVLTPIPPDRLVFLTAPLQVTAGSSGCAGPVTVEARDAFGNPSQVAAGANLSLSATAAAAVTFFSDSGCMQLTSTASIAAMGTTASFWLRATGAGAAHQVTVQHAALGMQSQGLTVDPAAPTQVLFTTSPHSVRVQACSGIATVRTADPFDNTAPVTAMTTLTPAEVPLGGVSFFSDPGCAVPLTAITLMPGQSTGSFYMRGGNTIQTVSVTVSSTGGLTSASQNQSVIVGLPNRITFTSAPKNVMAGECSGAMTVQSQDVAGNPSNVGSATNVNLAAGPATGVSFFTDASCTTPGAVVTISSGANTASFSMRGITGGSPLVTATGVAIANSGTQTITIQPMVRTGTCTLGSGSTNVPCAISPPLTDLAKTFFVFQATSTVTSIDDTAVRCALTDTSTLTCARGGTGGDVAIRWYTVSRHAGLTVQHLPAIAIAGGSGMATTNTTITSVNPASTFVLMSTSIAIGTTMVSSARWSSVRLANATTVEIRRQTTPDVSTTHAVQVVEWTGATVDRATVTLGNGSASATGAVPSSTDPQFLLYSWRYTTATGDREICRLAVRGAVTDATTLTFTRGAGALGQCDDHELAIEVERVRLPGHRVDPHLVSIPASQVDAAPVAIAQVDLTRAIAFFGATTFGGQSMGETADPTDDRFRDALARASFASATSVQVSRAEAATTGTAASLWTLYVWQLVP